ncbi:MAG TPA: fibronectin type III domain-containing protein, partial [Candidatus Limnocylindrales bacterium]
QIYSDWTGGGYQTEMGTSMASPHVAGVAALMLAANPKLTPADVRAFLRSSGECPNGQLADADGTGTCTGKGQWGNDPDGIAEPLVNALNAVEDVGGTPGDRRPVVRITSPTDGSTVSAPVTVTATATDDIGVTKVDFYVDGVLTATDSNGSDGYSMTWSPNIDGASYTLKATATDTTGQTSSAFVTVSTSPGVQGSWVGAYGHDGYILANWNGDNTDLASLPAGVTYALEEGARATWVSPTTDVRALTNPAGTERRSQTWYDANQMRVRLTFANPYSGTLHLYAVDWDAYGGNRYENITVDDGSGPRVAHLSSSFVPGAWIHAPISVGAGGSVVITVDRTAGNSAVLAGLFLGGASAPPPPAAPGAPSGLTATRGNGQVALTWTAPASNGGSAITGYTVTASPGGATCATATLGCTVTGLTNGTAYSFTVKATNAVGTGAASGSASATPATVPGAPTGLTATAGNAQVALTWTAPASTGGNAISGYTATASPGGATCASATLGCTIGGLTNGTQYTFTVTATNAVGTGPASAPASATPVAPPTAPGAPTGLGAIAGNAQVALAWTAPASTGGSPITGYRIYRGTTTGTETLLASVAVVAGYTDAAVT